MDGIYSHPPDEDGGKLLETHLRDAASRASELVPAEAKTVEDNLLEHLVRRTVSVHDIGKATSFFQNYIRGNQPAGPKHHSPLGGYVAEYVLEKTGYGGIERLSGYLAVSEHHGRLPDAREYVRKRTLSFDERKEEMRTQVQDVSENPEARKVAEDVIEKATDGEGSWTEFAEQFESGERFTSVKDLVVSKYGNSLKELDEGLYPLELQLWSALTLADKTDAAGVPRDELRGENLDPGVLERHIEALPPGEGERERRLNERREAARKEVLDNVEEFLEGNGGLGTITLPTGLGKTYTGMSAAMKIRNLQDGDGRVVYALPFTSIIDQLVDDVIDVFDVEPTDRTLTIHHHLSETVVETDDTDVGASEEYMLGESWRTGLIVTTFVQLFESLAGPKNSQSLKLPALYDSVIVLDEPQALPHRWWSLVRRIVQTLTEEYDATVVAMTATQPRVFEAGGIETFELIGDVDEYFVDAERVKYVLHDSADVHLESTGEHEPLGYSDAAEEITENDGESTLAICNTIASAEQLSSEIEETAETVNVNEVHGDHLEKEDTALETADAVLAEVEEKDMPAVAHLTTRMRPKDRLEIIKSVKKLTEEGAPVVTVSTQLIEAGVDISFDKVYRDFAPLDSIVQAAGRCNRSFEHERGEVVVWTLAPPEGKENLPSKTVYSLFGPSLLPVVAEAINSVRGEGERRIPGHQMSREAVESYYRKLHEKGLGEEELVEWFDDAEAERLGAESLINATNSVDVIVARTSDEKMKIQEIIDANDEGRHSKAGDLVDETKELRVSVPLYTEQDHEAVSRLNPVGENYEGLRYLKTSSDDSSKFDAKRGLVVQDDSVEDRFL